MLRTLFGSLLWLALLPFLAGCGNGSSNDQDLFKVTYGGSPWYGHIPAMVAQEKGFFKEEGIKCDFRTLDASMDRIFAIQGGSVDFASVGQVAMLSAMGQGNQSFYWVANHNIAPGFEGLVAHGHIKTWEELKGKRIAVQTGTSVDITIRLLLDDHGLDPEKDVKVLHMEGASLVSSFLLGDVDAAIIWEPHFSRLKAHEGAHVMGMDTDTFIYKDFGTMTGPDVLIVSRELVRENPQKAQAVLRAYFRAIDWMKDEKNLAEAAELATGRIKQPKEEIEAALRRIVWNGLKDQSRIMTDEVMFAQTVVVAKMLHEDMHKIETQPEFREWVRTDLLPSPSQ